MKDDATLANGGAADSAAPLVFWDGYGLASPASGVFVHARELANALKAQGFKPVIVGDEAVVEQFRDLPSAPLFPASIYAKLVNSKLVWPLRVRDAVLAQEKDRKRPFVLHGLSNINLPITGKSLAERHARYVVTVHDLIPLLAPRDVSRAYRMQFEFALPRVLKHADRIVCVSNWTKRTVLERFPQYEDKVRVIPNALTWAGLSRHRNEEREGKSKSGGRIRALCVSRDESYKNLGLLPKILKLATGTLEIDLVTNKSGVLRMRREAGEFIAQGALRLHSQISDLAMSELYSNTHIYIQPSRFEGFCLPAATALNFSSPVIYQSGSGIDEVVGEGLGVALTSDDGPKEWLQALEKGAELGQSQVFSQALENWLAAGSSWKDAASSLMSLYTEVITAR